MEIAVTPDRQCQWSGCTSAAASQVCTIVLPWTRLCEVHLEKWRTLSYSEMEAVSSHHRRAA